MVLLLTYMEKIKQILPAVSLPSKKPLKSQGKTDYIEVIEASEHNLKNISVNIPKNQFTVITGPSGSGKSSLAFDTIHKEGQKRYLDSLTSSARQLGLSLESPAVKEIKGLSLTLAIDQKRGGRNPRSTVGTITEVYDFLRVLYANLAEVFCPNCQQKLKPTSSEQIVKILSKNQIGSKLEIYAPVVIHKKGSHREVFEKYQKLGFSKVMINGEVLYLEDQTGLNKNKYHTIDILVDRIILKKGPELRLQKAIDMAFAHSKGFSKVTVDGKVSFFSNENFCSHCNLSFPPITPQHISFNSPVGMCQECQGIGSHQIFKPDTLLGDLELPLLKSLKVLEGRESFLSAMITKVAKDEGINISGPAKNLSGKDIKTLFYGNKKSYDFKYETKNYLHNFETIYPGIIPFLMKNFEGTQSDYVAERYGQMMITENCHSCSGDRLGPLARSLEIDSVKITELLSLEIDQSLEKIKRLRFKLSDKYVAKKLLKEIVGRLEFLKGVGLHYLSLSRRANTLSGGEAQRIRLASQLGSSLSGMIYILDEPSIGLHQKDNHLLLSTLKKIQNKGNTVVVVEHDEDTMLAADHIIDLGPKAGIDGGEVMASGTPEQLMNIESSPTGRFLKENSEVKVLKKPREKSEKISIKGVTKFNLKNVSVDIPTGLLTGITGVSGSGKSTLFGNVFIKAMSYELFPKRCVRPKEYESIIYPQEIRSIVKLDQSPIGRTPKSNPATYSGAFDYIRSIFSKLPQSQIRGYAAGRFSFNVKGGRCDECEGGGQIKLENQFLENSYVLCPKCDGKRYNEDTLQITHKGLDISEVLALDISLAKEHFRPHAKLHKILKTMDDVGMGHLKLGQSSMTLSGGEAQRLKLAKELHKNTKGKTVYFLDEPTTGLHYYDIQKLLDSLNRLVDLGHTVMVIEHNLDFIKACDHIIDLGPGGGREGGQIIAEGSPREVSKIKNSLTGSFL